MRFLRTNTAVIIAVGPFYDKTDGVTPETALTITNERISLIAETDDGSAPTYILDNIAGATSGTANDLNYITSGDNAMMQMELAAADVNRLGRMFLTITDAANHVPVFHEYMVMPALVFDTYFASTGGATFPAATLASTTNITAATGIDVTKLGGVGQSLTDLKDFADTGYDPATHKVAGVVLTDTLTTYTGNTVQTGDSFARIGAAGAGLTAIDLPNQTMDITGNITGNLSGSVGSVNGNVVGSVGSVTGLTASNLDATVSSRATQASVDTIDGIVDAILVDTAEIGVAGAGLTAVVAASVSGSVGSVAGNVVGSVGSVVGLTASNLDTTVSSRLASASYVAPDNAGIAAIQGKTDDLQFTLPGILDVNIVAVNEIEVIGTGVPGDTWGPI